MIPRISRWKHSQPPKKLSHASFFGLGGSISGNRCRWIRRMQDRVQREAFSRASLPPLSLFPFFSTSFFQPRPISPLLPPPFFLTPVNPLESIISARSSWKNLREKWRMRKGNLLFSRRY